MRIVLSRKMIALLTVFVSATATCCPQASAQDMRRTKKLIATGWDQVDSSRLSENLDQMEERPFDGVVIRLEGIDDQGKTCSLRTGFSREAWKTEWFQPAVQRLKACQFKRFTDNFVIFGANPGDVDWFDDRGWESIVEHWRIAAKVAQESGCKGILFDPEPYTRPFRQFAFEAQPDRDKHTFDEYYAKARQRGRQVMEAVAGEYPEITIFCYFLNSVNLTATGTPDPRAALASLGYGLLPAMLDGWLDVIPPSVVLVDGCESAYRYNSSEQYLKAAVNIKGACQELVSPENRAKYRAQVQVGFGVYLDAYWNPKDSEWGAWYIDGLGGSRVDRLRANVASALYAADQYVWVYGEKFRWWPTPNGRVKQETWPEALPDCDQILHYLRDPLEYARGQIARLKAAGELENLALNGPFNSEVSVSLDGNEQRWSEGRPPAGWHAWQDSASTGTFTWDCQQGSEAPGAARAAGVAWGCFLQHHAVEPGQRYAVGAACKLQGRGTAALQIRWQTAEGGWTRELDDKRITCRLPADDWSRMFGVVQVPEGVGKLVVLLGMRGQESEDDLVWYDDVEVYRLP